MLFGLGVVLCCAGLVILMLSRNSSIHSLTLGIAGGPLGLLPKMVPFVRALPQHIVSTTEQFYYVKKSTRFVILYSNLKFSMQPLRFFDIINPRRKENLLSHKFYYQTPSLDMPRGVFSY